MIKSLVIVCACPGSSCGPCYAIDHKNLARTGRCDSKTLIRYPLERLP